MIERFVEKPEKQKKKRWLPWLLPAIGGIVLLIILFNDYNGLDLRPEEQLSPPTLSHPFGTDPDGRDIFIRVIMSIKAYLAPGTIAIGLSILLGLGLGAASSKIWKGHVHHLLSFITSSFMDVLEALPKYILLLLLLTLIRRPQFAHLMIALGIINSSKIGKLVAEKIDVLTKREFVEASLALGLKKWDVILRHILFYNCFPIFVIQASLIAAEVILIEVGLSYLGSISHWGLGTTIPEPMPSWGNMLVMGKDYLRQGWWMIFFPLTAVVSSVLGLYSLADFFNRKLGAEDE